MSGASRNTTTGKLSSSASHGAGAATGKLIICPTPIGNLGDVTSRTLESLAQADVVCAEDTRVTGKLLATFDIKKPVERLDEAVMGNRAASIVVRIEAGETIAYCSDAGMPGVSDPGLRLVRAARDAGVCVEVLPGASAVTTAYVASGITCPQFYFGGFFPRKAGERTALLEQLRTLDAALIFYESPKRLVGALAAIAQAFPTRDVAVCRELTKLHEEVVRDVAPAVADAFATREQIGDIKGEIVVVIDVPSDEEASQRAAASEDNARAAAATLRAAGKSRKDIAHELQERFGISRNAAYAIAHE